MPAFLGLVPPTTLVPVLWISSSDLFRDRDERINTVGDGLLGMETVEDLARQRPAHRIRHDRINWYSRSLLASEALEKHPGVLVDLQVVHGVGISRGGLKVGPSLLAGNIADGREGGTAKGLHDCKRVELKG